MENNNFKQAKENYYNERLKQRNNISLYLRRHSKFKNCAIAARKGRQNYKSAGRISKNYDLRNWLWVTVCRNNVNFIISLQPFDTDKATGNMHILMDRIGIYAYVGTYSTNDARTKMLLTEMELPLDENDLSKIAQLIVDLSECSVFNLQKEFNGICIKNELK